MKHSPFTRKILQWYAVNKRHLPWRGTVEPFRIWLSEVLLQQTRVQQGLPYYERFIREFPTVRDLAAADEEKVLKLWQGLGYYSRARNLKKAAEMVVDEYGGTFPNTVSELKTLPGVGDYTAAAIASICYNLPEAVVDGNVYRVLARYFGIDIPIDSAEGKRHFRELASELLDRENPGDFNQAVMEFGAMVCTPAKPGCMDCVLAASCAALQKDLVKQLPIKSRKTGVRKRYFNYVVLRDPEHRTILEQRKGKGIWQNLYQFPLIESDKTLDQEEFGELLKKEMPGYSPLAIFEPNPSYQVHKLSHQHLVTKFWVLPLPDNLENGITIEEAHKLPVPVLVADTLKTLKNSYF